MQVWQFSENYPVAMISSSHILIYDLELVEPTND